MTLKVEDGTGKPDADSYFEAQVFRDWCEANGYDISDKTNNEVEVSIRRGTRYVDLNFRGRFPGYPRRGRAQSREWPRLGAYTTISSSGRDEALGYSGNTGAYGVGTYQLREDEIPKELVEAVCEASYREVMKPGALLPDLKNGGAAIQSAGAGSAQVTFFAGGSQMTLFQSLDITLEPLLIVENQYTGKVIRG